MRRLHRLSKANQGSWGRTVGGGRSQEQALPLPLLDGGWAENRPDRLIKHCLEAPLRERRALQVFDGTCGKHSLTTGTGQGSTQKDD